MSLIRANNAPLLNGKERSYLTVSVAAGDGTATVADYAQFTINNYVLVGELGQEGSEIIKIHASTVPTSAGVITFASNLVYPHSINDPVVQIDFNQVEFSRATTTTGSKSVLATSNIEADDLYTSYNDIVNSTGYGFVRYKNSATTTYSSYSGPIPYAGLEQNSVRKLKDQALTMVHERVGGLITDDFLLQELNNWQYDVTRQKDWDFEMDSATDTLVTSQENYTVSTDLKYQSTNRSIINLHLSGEQPMQYIDKTQYEEILASAPSDGKPVMYTIYNGELLLTPPPSSDFSGDTLYYDFIKKVPELTQDTDTTIIPFHNTSQYYLAWKIEELKGNDTRADRYRQLYENRLAGEMRRNRDMQDKGFRVWTPWTKRYR